MFKSKIGLTVLFTALTSSYSALVFAQAKTPCGSKGSINERIADCGNTKIGGYEIVSKSFPYYLLYDDDAFVLKLGNLLISSPLLMLKEVGYGQAKRLCRTKALYSRPEFGSIKNVKWRLPTEKEAQRFLDTDLARPIFYKNGLSFGMAYSLWLKQSTRLTADNLDNQRPVAVSFNHQSRGIHRSHNRTEAGVFCVATLSK